MSRARIPAALRLAVAERARHRCGYCLTTAISGVALVINHLTPVADGGEDDEDNLWLACVDCNQFKSDRTMAEDPHTGVTVPLFNPRRHAWRDHFEWSSIADTIIALTPTGRATLHALQLNRHILVCARRVWIAAGAHPPPG